MAAIGPRRRRTPDEGRRRQEVPEARPCPGRRTASARRRPAEHQRRRPDRPAHHLQGQARQPLLVPQSQLREFRRGQRHGRGREPPAVSITGGDLVSGRWVRGEQPITYTASDRAGVQGASVLLSGGNAGGRGTRATTLVRCRVRAARLHGLGTGQGPGRHPSGSGVPTDAAGNAGSSAPVVARVDNTSPLQVPVAAQGGEAWRAVECLRRNLVESTEGDAAPIDGAMYRICRAGGAARTRRRAATATADLSSVRSPLPGEWTLKLWRRDQAGNASEDNASHAGQLRYDPRRQSWPGPGQLQRSDVDVARR